ncbi:MAG: hypothetical protein HYV97_14720 [Bdellovibrio sp.]|nr:hypothetical protein [Bdellovibrio sp.]
MHQHQAEKSPLMLVAEAAEIVKPLFPAGLSPAEDQLASLPSNNYNCTLLNPKNKMNDIMRFFDYDHQIAVYAIKC